MSGFTMEDFTITVDSETGHRFAKFETDSNMLPVEQPDTYHTYSNEYAVEQFLEYQDENGEPSDYDDYDWKYDTSAVIRGLGELGAADVISQLGTDILKTVEVTSTYSPREYNFTTDSYRAVWEFDLDKLEAWAAENNFNARDYAKKHHGSYDGFMSFVEGWLEDERSIEGTSLWLTFAAYIRSELDENQNREAMLDGLSELWDQNMEPTLKTED